MGVTRRELESCAELGISFLDRFKNRFVEGN